MDGMWEGIWRTQVSCHSWCQSETVDLRSICGRILPLTRGGSPQVSRLQAAASSGGQRAAACPKQARTNGERPSEPKGVQPAGGWPQPASGICPFRAGAASSGAAAAEPV